MRNRAAIFVPLAAFAVAIGLSFASSPRSVHAFRAQSASTCCHMASMTFQPNAVVHVNITTGNLGGQVLGFIEVVFHSNGNIRASASVDRTSIHASRISSQSNIVIRLRKDASKSDCEHTGVIDQSIDAGWSYHFPTLFNVTTLISSQVKVDMKAKVNATRTFENESDTIETVAGVETGREKELGIEIDVKLDAKGKEVGTKIPLDLSIPVDHEDSDPKPIHIAKSFTKRAELFVLLNIPKFHVSGFITFSPVTGSVFAENTPPSLVDEDEDVYGKWDVSNPDKAILKPTCDTGPFERIIPEDVEFREKQKKILIKQNQAK